MSVGGEAPASGRPASSAHEPALAMSVDVEEYFQVQAFAGIIPRAEWDRWPSRVEANTERMLALHDAAGAKGTFFVLGCVAEKHPGLVRRIAAAGHEIGSHGMSHRMITELSPEQMRAEARDSRRLLEDLSGTAVIGYRAPSYTINPGTRWALDILVEAGYAYDSSIFPIRGRRYGYPDGPTLPTRLATGSSSIAEFPLTTLGAGRIRIPLLAGSYLRLLPAWISETAVRYHIGRRRPLVVNIHTWEIDPDQPTVGPSRRKKWTHYTRIGATSRTLARVLRLGRFASIRERLEDLGLLDAAPA